MVSPRKVIIHLGRSFKELMAASPVYKRTAIVSALLVLLTTLLPLWRVLPQVKESPFIPLHYNIYLGVDSFGPWYSIFVLPGLGLTLLLINLIFEAVFFKREHVLSYFFAYATVFSEVILLVAMILIVLLNL